MTRPLLIGETPSRAEGPDAWKRPLSGKIAKTLCQMADLEAPWYASLRAHFDCVNAFITPIVIPSSRSDYLWLQARTYVEQSVELFKPACVVCLGRNASIAAGLSASEDWGRWSFHRQFLHVVVPHPSGLNRLYNDPAMLGMARCALRRAMEIADERSAVDRQPQ